MAKPHKFAWNGVDVETTLGIEQLANMAQRAAQECTGDLFHGKHRIVSVKSTDRQIEFRINDFLITFKKFMVFNLEFEVRNGRTWMSSRIAWYVTTQPTVGGFIPAGTKSMVGHHTYIQFVHHLADQVRASDPQARITFREGVASTTGPASSTPNGSASAPPAPAGRPAPIAHPSGPAPTSAPGPVPPPPAAGEVATGAFLVPPPPSSPAYTGRGPVPPPPPPPSAGPRAAATQPPAPTTGGLVTSVPGMPQRQPSAERSVEVQPAGFASLAEQLFAEDDELFHTRMVQASDAALPWLLRFADGRGVPLVSTLVLGRNPAPPAGGTATPLALQDPHRSVSKTHALIELRDGLPWVTDLHSTNGTTLTNDVGEALICEPEVPMPLGDGWRVGLGEYSFTILRVVASP